MTNISKNIAYVRKMQRQNGMTFIEVLIALVIIVTGILGAVALQAVAKKSSFDSMQRSLASSLAQDIIERMRGNDADAINTYTVGSPFSGGGGAAPTNCNQLASNCTPAQITTHDIYEWKQSLIGAGTIKGTDPVGGLVDGVGCIAVNGRTVTVAISWQGKTELSDGASAVGGSSTCGTSNNKRRQVVVNAFIL